MLALADDFRTLDWTEIIKYPELVYEKSEQFLVKEVPDYSLVSG